MYKSTLYIVRACDCLSIFHTYTCDAACGMAGFIEKEIKQIDLGERQDWSFIHSGCMLSSISMFMKNIFIYGVNIQNGNVFTNA